MHLTLVLCVATAVNCAAQFVSVGSTSITQAFQVEGSPVTYTLSVSGGGNGTAVTVSFETDAGGNWLNVTPAGGSIADGKPLIVSVTMAPAGLPDGTYTGMISVHGTAPAGAIEVPVTITVGDPGPQLPSNGVVNAASSQGGAIAPGELVTLFGSGIGPPILYPAKIQDGAALTKLAGTRVWFDNTPAPLIYATASQISAIVPYDVAGKKTIQVRVENMVARSLPVTIAIQEAAPALFTADSSGGGQLAALNEDGSANSSFNPAAKGSIVVVFATGAGLMNPPVPDGKVVSGEPLPKPSLPVSVTFGGQSAEILYAGAAPRLVSGVLQVNVRVPSNAPSGAVPATLAIGTFASPAGTTIAVQ